MLNGLSADDFKRIGERSGFTQIEELSVKQNGEVVFRFRASVFVSLALLIDPLEDKKRFETLQLFTKFPKSTDLKKINAWNEQRRFVRGYASGDAMHFEMDVYAVGVNEPYIETHFSLWSATLFDITNFDW